MFLDTGEAFKLAPIAAVMPFAALAAVALARHLSGKRVALL